jgi:acyl-coenzyme A thioesterase PaaI-like protein
MPDERAFQDCYPDDLAHCYGCGRLNEQGLRVQSYWDGDETVCRYLPAPHHTALPGFVYGGLIASIIDCHATGSAAAAGARAEGRPVGTFRYVTAALKVDYVAPTPLGPPLELRGRIKEIKGRKVVVAVTVRANGVETARGEVVAVRLG